MALDLNALVLGLAFGLGLATAIVLLLAYAIVNTPQVEDTSGIGNWRRIAKYESRRTYLHAANHDPDTFDW